MLRKHLAFVVVTTALSTGAAFAQSSNQAATSSPTNSTSRQWVTELKPDQWRASSLKGLDVYNSKDEKIGDVNELLIDRDGKIEAVVIGVGGFLGVGEHEVAVPFGQMKWVDEPRAVSTAANRSVNMPPATPGTAPGRLAAPDPNAPMTTGSVEPSDRSAQADARRSYPDHALLDMSKDQLKAAPEFKYAR